MRKQVDFRYSDKNGKKMRYLISFLALLCFLQVRGQLIKQFTPDSVKFLQEMTIFLTTQRKKEGKEFIELFTPVWYGGKLSESKRQRVYKICNRMLEKKMNPFPDFKGYLFSLISFVKTNQPENSFQSWQETIENLINSTRTKKFSDYLAFSDALFSDNAIYKSASTIWQSSSSHYSFQYDNEPIVTFSSIDLRCIAKGDSAVIYNTSGVYYPNKYKWVGTGGKINWVRAGFDENTVYTILRDYEISCRTSSFIADSVVFYNSDYFDKPLMGKLTEKVLANVTPEKASYPRFDSYNKRLKIKNIFKGVDYDGGFSQYGSKFVGKGSEDEDAYMVFNREGKAFLLASSKAFSIRSDKVYADPASIVIYLRHETKDGMVTDSIIHPGIKFKYEVNTRRLSLLRSNEGVNKSPYFNSFHHVDMYFEELKWNVDSPIISFGPLTGSTDHSAIFESDFFYRESRFDRMMGIDKEHPLYIIKHCFEKNDAEELLVSNIARCAHLPITQIQPMLMRLSQEGFIYYDFDDDYVRPNEKLYHYMNAKSNREDYDVIQFNSDVKHGNNATISLLNFDMMIEGVKSIFLSDSQNVTIYPKGGIILLKQNRDFVFTGVVNAGKFQYFGKEFTFNYNDFKLKMPNVDSLRIWVTTKSTDKYGKKRLKKVKSVIEYINGELKIDGPGNKSGKEDLAEYPIFTSKNKSYVFYDKGSICKGVYSRDRFFFELVPFKFDSLDNFTNSQLRFDGRFQSSDIFPEFNETLTLMPDRSLGFSRRTPQSGYPVYKEKGIFKKTIQLSNKGLRGDGVLNYIKSTTQSDNFIFYPDSMSAIAQSFINEEQIEEPQYPPVWGKNVEVFWRPYKDFLKVKEIDQPLTFYDGKSKLHGSLMLRPSGISGKGVFEFEDAELEAQLIKFKFKEFDSDTADFRLKALMDGEKKLAFSTNDYKAHVDFQTRKGEFLSNGSGSFIDFPENQYIAFMNKFTWYMESNDIELSADVKATTGAQKDIQLEGAKFISVHPDQDSLTFFSPAAKFDVNHSIIYANEVKYIQVADAMIYPDSSKIIVDKHAKIRTLENARILANFVTQYHNIYNATVNILARKNYIGSGDYDYIDENKRTQMIHFNNVAVDTTAQTYATGTITEEMSFILSPAFKFKGDIKLSASNPYLTFSGLTRIFHECTSIPISWFAFTAEIDPTEIYIPIDTLIIDANKNPLSAGIRLAKDSVHIYTAFASKVGKSTDPEILSVSGFMFYDKNDKEYKISNMEKLNEMSLPGNYLSLNTQKCKVYGEGKLSFGTKLGQVKLKPVGNISQFLQMDSNALELLLSIDFFFADKALEKMAKKMTDNEELDPTDFDRPVYLKGITDLIGKVEADKAITDMNLYGSFKKFPAELNKSIFINSLKMKWDKKTNSYQSLGRICIGNILKKQVNKFVDGHVEIIKKRSGDIINIYLELEFRQWYFFSYQRNLMQAISSDEEFNSIIKEVKSDKRKYKHKKGEAPYSYMIGSEIKKQRFLKQYETIGE